MVIYQFLVVPMLRGLKLRKANAIIMLTISLGLLAAIRIPNTNATEVLIWSSSVYSSGQPVTSPILESGIQYRIVATEIFWYYYPNYTEAHAADAMYYTDTNQWVWASYYPAPGGGSFLQINEQSVDWGPFSNGVEWPWSGHTYSINYTGTGTAISFRIVDLIDGDYRNNYCHLPVYIYKTDIPPPPIESGHSPGYWKHQFNAYFEGKGKAQETWEKLELYTGKIDAYYDSTPPYFLDCPLPTASLLDLNNDSRFGMDDAHMTFTDATHNELWLGLANWYNWASGLKPYI